MLKIKNKRSLILVLLILVTIVANGCKGNVEGVLAQVNKEKITEAEYKDELDINRKIFIKQYGDEILSQVGPDGNTIDENLKQELLDKLIIEELISQKSKENDITVTEEEVDAKLEEIKASVGGEEGYKNFLDSNGISEEYFKNTTRKEILMEKYYENYLENTELKQEEIEEFFEENKDDLVVVRARHILLKDEEEASKVLDRLEAGEEFEEVALEESLDGSAAQGGDLGYFTKGNMIKEFEDAAFALKVGEISGLVKTEVGYHIIKVEDRKESLEDLEEQIAMVLKQQKYEEHIKDLKDKADIDVLIDLDEIENDSEAEEETPEKEESEEAEEGTEAEEDTEVEPETKK